MNLDLAFVSALLKCGDMQAVLDAGIRDEHLFDAGRKAFAAVKEHYLSYGKFPERSVVTQLVPEAKALLDAEANKLDVEPIQFYIDQLLARMKRNLANRTIVESETLLTRGNADAVVARMKKGISEIQNFGTAGKVIARPDYFAQAMKADYEVAKHAGDGVSGYRSAWESLDNTTAGFQKSDLVIICARPGIGKTWCGAKLVSGFYDQGATVGVASLEMPRKAMLKRIVACRAKIPALDLRKGQLAQPVEDRYFQVLNDLTGMDRLTLVGDGMVRSLEDLEMFVEESNLDVLYVDGLYLIDAHSREERITRVARVVWGLKQLALRKNILIVGTTQLGRKVTGENKGKLENLSFADDIGMTADIVMSLWRDRDMIKLRQMELMTLKVREAPGDLDISINWDLNLMDFGELGKQRRAEATDEVVAAKPAQQALVGF